MSRFLTALAPSPSDESSVRRGAPSEQRVRKRRGPASCRACGKALVTPGERTIGRCRSCPATFEEDFFERLRSWRIEQANTRGVPAYVVFTDATLVAIAEQLPADIAALGSIPGVGPMKLEAYGDEVLSLVAEAKTESSDRR